MTRAKRLLVVGTGLLALGVTACNNDKLTELNKNPNNPEDVPASSLFTFATQVAVGRWLGFGYSARGADLLIQHLAQVQYPDEDSYSRLTGGSTAGYFDGAYQVELMDLQKVIDKGTAAADPGTSAPAEVMRAWAFSNLTNTWGDVPYSQALQGDLITGSLAPVYDAQSAIYTDLFARLAAASTALATASNSLADADPLYDGAPASWQRFANSLRARLALQIINQDPATAGTQLTAALAAANGGIITTNANNAQLNWPGDGLYNNPWSDNFKSRDDHRLSRTFMTILANTADPRVTVFAMPATRDTVPTPFITKYCTGAPPCYVGLQNALTQAQAGPYIPYTSRPGAAFYPGVTVYGTFGGAGATWPSFVFTAAEGNFIMAEAAERGLAGLTPAQAQGFYEAGIRASMDQWGITNAATQTAYITGPNVLYTAAASTAARQTLIATQNWIALYADGGTAWANWRRTCVPASIAAGPNATQATVPRRFQYSSTEYSVNRVNVLAALTAQNGADDFDTRMYWDRTPTAAATYNAAACLGD